MTTAQNRTEPPVEFEVAPNLLTCPGIKRSSSGTWDELLKVTSKYTTVRYMYFSFARSEGGTGARNAEGQGRHHMNQFDQPTNTYNFALFVHVGRSKSSKIDTLTQK